MLQQSEKYDIDRIFRLIVSLITLAFIFGLIYYLRTILIPFAIAFVIAYILDPLADFFVDRLKVPRVLAILIIFILIVAIAFLLIRFVFIYMLDELRQFGTIFPTYVTGVYDYVASKFDENSMQNIEQFLNLNTIIENLQTSQMVETILEYLTGLASQIWNLFALLIGGVIVVMYVFFLLRDIDRVRSRWMLYIPRKYRDTVQMFVSDTYHYTVTFFRGQLIIVSILGILFAVGFSIVNIPLAILVGLTAGFLNLIPNFGTLVAIIPAILLAIGRAEELNSMNQVALGGIFNNHMSLIGGVLLVFLVVQIIQDFILVPKIMGKRTGLRPATILFSVFVWGKLLGFLGVILAIPLTCLTKVYFARFILKDDPESTKTEEQ